MVGNVDKCMHLCKNKQQLLYMNFLSKSPSLSRNEGLGKYYPKAWTNQVQGWIGIKSVLYLNGWARGNNFTTVPWWSLFPSFLMDIYGIFFFKIATLKFGISNLYLILKIPTLILEFPSWKFQDTSWKFQN